MCAHRFLLLRKCFVLIECSFCLYLRTCCNWRIFSQQKIECVHWISSARLDRIPYMPCLFLFYSICTFLSITCVLSFSFWIHTINVDKCVFTQYIFPMWRCFSLWNAPILSVQIYLSLTTLSIIAFLFDAFSQPFFHIFLHHHLNEFSIAVFVSSHFLCLFLKMKQSIYNCISSFKRPINFFSDFPKFAFGIYRTPCYRCTKTNLRNDIVHLMLL